MLPEGATIAPVIIASDKTQLTQFSGSKSAYPVYLTIGNILKAIRCKPSKRACVLITYLSVDKIICGTMTKHELGSRSQWLFHESMRTVLECLMDAGKNRVEMTGGDGVVRCVFPILSAMLQTTQSNASSLVANMAPVPNASVQHHTLGMTIVTLIILRTGHLMLFLKQSKTAHHLRSFTKLVWLRKYRQHLPTLLVWISIHRHSSHNHTRCFASTIPRCLQTCGELVPANYVSRRTR
jgi:Plavaka transposase